MKQSLSKTQLTKTNTKSFKKKLRIALFLFKKHNWFSETSTQRRLQAGWFCWWSLPKGEKNYQQSSKYGRTLTQNGWDKDKQKKGVWNKVLQVLFKPHMGMPGNSLGGRDEARWLQACLRKTIPHVLFSPVLLKRTQIATIYVEFDSTLKKKIDTLLTLKKQQQHLNYSITWMDMKCRDISK